LRAAISKLRGNCSTNETADRWTTVWKQRHQWLQGYGEKDLPSASGESAESLITGH
jgi:hypothetical protein